MNQLAPRFDPRVAVCPRQAHSQMCEGRSTREIELGIMTIRPLEEVEEVKAQTVAF